MSWRRRASLATLVGSLLCASLALGEAPMKRADGTRVLTHTRQVEDVLLDETTLWVASTGGLERYDLGSGARVGHWTTLDGLDSNHVRTLALPGGGALVATTVSGRCTLQDEGRFSCTPECATAPPIRQLTFFEGARVVEVIDDGGGQRVIATSGHGVWLQRPSQAADGIRRKLTPSDQICSNHVTDILAFKGRRFYGSFDDGLCSETLDAPGVFAPAALTSRRINDLFVTEGRLYVASSDGVHFSEDGIRWERLVGIDGAVTALARDGRFLVAASTSALHWAVLRNHRIRSAYWAPGGTGSIQDMAIDTEGTVFLATEDHGVIRIEQARKRSERVVRYFDRAAGAPSSWVLSVSLGHDGTLYAGTLRHGAFRIVEDRVEPSVVDARWLLRVREHGAVRYFGSQDGAVACGDDAHREGACTPIGSLPDPRVHEFYLARNELYVATESGLVIQPAVR